MSTKGHNPLNKIHSRHGVRQWKALGLIGSFVAVVGTSHRYIFGSPIHLDLVFPANQNLDQSLQTSFSGAQPYFPTPAKGEIEYLVSRNVTPRPYDMIDTNSGCLWDMDSEHSLSMKKDVMSIWGDHHLKSGCSVYPIPSDPTIFHIAWSGPWRDFLEFPLDSFLLTQNLTRGAELWFWYTEDFPPPTLALDKYTGVESKHAGFIKFKPLNVTTLALGTCFETRPDFLGFRDYGADMAGFFDMVRVLLMYRYGGIWLDSDTVLMRDLTPLIRTGAFAASIGRDRDVYNGALQYAGYAGGPTATRLLESICSIPVRRSDWPYKSFKPVMDNWGHNDGVLKACERIFHCGIQVIPLAYTDGYAWTAYPLSTCLKGPRQKHVDDLGRLFAYHTRADDYNLDECLVPENEAGEATPLWRTRDALNRGLLRDDWRQGHGLFPEFV